jgi:small-conductance mechanosensitive channel
MPDSNAAPPNKKRPFDFDDIMSMLDEGKPGTPAKAPALEPAAVKPEPETSITVIGPPAGQPETRVIKTESVIVEPQKPAAAEALAAQVAPPVAAPRDNAIVDRLLADFAEKNAEILRLNNELTQIKYEVREKEQKITALASIEAVLDQKEEAIKGRDAVIKDKDAVIRDKEESIKDKEAAIKDKEAALKEKDAILKERESLLKEIEATLTAKDNEIKAYEVKVMELEARMSEMAEQLGTLRKFSNRESGHEPYVEPAASPGEKQEINVQEKMTSAEDDVASIFRRLAEAKVELAEGEEGREQPRRPRSAKLYDL